MKSAIPGSRRKLYDSLAFDAGKEKTIAGLTGGLEV
jgi:hypothetical protein